MLGYKFRRQYLYQGFIIDFYCPGIRLAIEVDGGAHNDQKDYDRAREAVIEDSGIKMLRFTNKEVLNDPITMLKKINKNLPLSGLLHRVEKGDHDEVVVDEARDKKERVL